jgi:hypothetical protein
MNYPPPNGYFFGDFVVYGAFQKGSSISRGFRLFPADQQGSSEGSLAETHTLLVRYLQALPLGVRLQFCWRKNSDFRDALARYDAVTAAVTNLTVKERRSQTSRRFRDLMDKRQLKREHLELYPCIHIDEPAPSTLSGSVFKEYLLKLTKRYTSVFEQFYRELTISFGTDVVITPMKAEDHFFSTYIFYNSDYSGDSSLPLSSFDPSLSILGNCCSSDIVADKLGRVFFSNCYHNILTLQLPGSHTYESMILQLTKSDYIDYSISVICESLDTYKVMMREEAASQSLQKQQLVADTKSQLTESARNRADEAVDDLSKGHTRIFRCWFIIRAWSADESRLAEKVSALKSGVLAMKNAKLYEHHLEASTLDLLYLTIPGNAFHPYNHRSLELQDVHLANLLPYSASFTGDLEDPQALYISADNALLGLRFQKHGVVQHTGILGATRTGKSELYADAMMQSAPFFDYDVIVETGLSHVQYTRAFGCEPIIIRRDGNITLNYLDTGSLPLNPEHIGLAVAQTLHMCGSVSGSDGNRIVKRRKSLLAYYIDLVFQEAALNWQNHHESLLPDIQREACAVSMWTTAKMKKDDTLLDGFTDLRLRVANNEDEALSFIANITESQITSFCTNPATSYLPTRHTFAYFEPEDYPQHRDLYELFALRPSREHPKEDIQEIADLLREWTADQGSYGPLFDGVTNRRLTDRVVHFEVGSADRTDNTLRTAIALTIAGKIRQIIVQMPRSTRKRFSWEEFAADLDVEGNDNLAKELIAQLAKMNCEFTYLLQNYQQFKDSRVCGPLLSNTTQFLMLRQEDPNDIQDLGARISVPESLRTKIANYPRVVNLPPDDRYSSFCYFSRAAYPPIAGTGKYFMLPSTKPNTNP